jgi:Arc/MetJ family transcription regulator
VSEQTSKKEISRFKTPFPNAFSQATIRQQTSNNLNRLFHGKRIRIAKWAVTHIVIRVKTTVELDEQKLLRVMELTGLKTRKEAIDYALSQAERAAKIAKLFGRPRRSKEELKNLLDPKYDLMTLREQEKPRT